MESEVVNKVDKMREMFENNKNKEQDCKNIIYKSRKEYNTKKS